VSGAEWCLTFAAVACVFGAIATAMTARWALAAFLSGMTAVAYAVLALFYALHGDGLLTGVHAFNAAMWAWIWWRRRRGGRKRSLRQLGHKARARLAALARNMPRPGPVLRPVPQAARA